MKILHIYNDYYPPIYGGIEKHINTICEGLKDRFKMQVLVCGRRFSNTTEIVNGIQIIKAGELGRFQSAPIAPFFPFLLKKLTCDILHFHLPCPTAVISYFLAKPKGKLIITYHSDIIRQRWALGIYGPILTRFLQKADCIIATSPTYIESSPFHKKVKDKCKVIPHGIDMSRFYTASPAWPTILFVGNLRSYKGLEYLIKAMICVNAKLLIIGTGKEERRLKKLTQKYQLQEKISFLGNIPDQELPYYYATCTIFVLPSIQRSEAFGIVQLEAMASEKPVISTNLGTGVSWVNKNRETGLIVPPKDHVSLAKSINKLLQDPELREELGKKAKKRVQDKFTTKSMLEDIVKTYLICCK